MPIIPTRGSVQQIMPAAGAVEFTTPHETWTLPLVAYAVVVRYVSTDDPHARDIGDHVEVETTIEPVVIYDDGGPTTLHSYLEDCTPWPQWRVIQP